MSEINPFRGLVGPSSTPQRVQPKKDQEQGRRERQHEHPQEAEEQQAPTEGEDGKPHVDLKA